MQPLARKTVRNFGGNVVFEPAYAYVPESEEEVLAILARHRGEKIRVVGRLHSWSDAPSTSGVLLDLRRLCDVRVERDEGGARTVAGAGCQIKRLLRELRRQAGMTVPRWG